MRIRAKATRFEARPGGLLRLALHRAGQPLEIVIPIEKMRMQF
jgi:hypothetical protein